MRWEKRVSDGSDEGLMGGSQCRQEGWEGVKRMLASVASSQVPVLLVGRNRGVCRVIARMIHAQSPRRMQRLVVTSCGLFQPAQLERQFFGESAVHSRSYVRRNSQSVGHLQAAHGGSLYVEQIAHATPLMQDRLLQLLSARTYYNPATGEPRESDVRIIATTAHPIGQYVAAKRMGAELAQRLSVVTIDVPLHTGPRHGFSEMALEARLREEACAFETASAAG